MIETVLLLGGNCGDMIANLSSAREHIQKSIGKIIRQSTIHKSEAWGFDSDPFHNQVLVVVTQLDAETILERIWSIERLFGRERGTKDQELAKYTKRQNGEIGYSARAMDIDILYYGESKINTQLLTIPHPLIHQRDFVMKPLIELGILK